MDSPSASQEIPLAKALSSVALDLVEVLDPILVSVSFILFSFESNLLSFSAFLSLEMGLVILVGNLL